MEIVETVFATAEASEIVRKTYLVIENDPSDTDAENVDALADWLIASAGANLTKLFNWES